MINNKYVTDKFAFLGDKFLIELEECAIISDVKPRTELIKPDEKIQYLPIVLDGSVMVYTLNDGRELLYYYVKPGESCIMTLSSIFQNCKSRVYAFSKEASQVMLIPVANFLDLVIRYPEINKIFFDEYNNRFTSLMNMVNDAIFHKLDTRVLNYVKKQSELMGKNPVVLSHKEIASGLGTAREVVSRVLKKLANEGHLIQHKYEIEILNETK